MGTECTSATHSIFKVFGYSGNKDCKYHIHFFELNVGGKKKPAKTFLEIKVSETTSNLVMLCAQKIPSQTENTIPTPPFDFLRKNTQSLVLNWAQK